MIRSVKLVILFLFAPGELPVTPDIEPSTGTVSDPAVVDPVAPPAPEVDPNSDAGLVAAEDAAEKELADALDASQKATVAVTTATDRQKSASAALGSRVSQGDGLGILLPDGRIRVLLPDGKGGYHPVIVKGVNTPASAPTQPVSPTPSVVPNP